MRTGARNAPRRRLPARNPEPYLVWVSVVVVVVGPGSVVCCDVVDVLCVVSDAQALSDTRAAITRDGMIIFFMNMVFLNSDRFRTIQDNLIG
jgi:hypothetical protein